MQRVAFVLRGHCDVTSGRKISVGPLDDCRNLILGLQMISLVPDSSRDGVHFGRSAAFGDLSVNDRPEVLRQVSA